MLVTGLVVVMSSCKTSKEEAPLSTLNGEWRIIEIDNTTFKANPEQEAPFIGFDIKTGRMFGFTGCNRVMASFDINTKPGILDLSSVGATRMACPDLTLEHSILSALSDVKKFEEKDTRVALCNEDGKALLLLEKIPPFTVAELQGKWSITEVDNESVPTDMENQPFIEFDLKTKRIHGNAGCNIMNGDFETSETDPSVISFPGVITTMMSCPDMEIEGKILAAVNSVKTFAKVHGGVGLYNGEGQLVLTIEKFK